MQHFWNPVGSSLMPEDDTRHLARTLFAGDDGEAMVQRIDRRVDRLPGLGDLHLLTGAFGRYAAA